MKSTNALMMFCGFWVLVLSGLTIYSIIGSAKNETYCKETYGGLAHYVSHNVTEDGHKYIVCNWISGSLQGKYAIYNQSNESMLIRGLNNATNSR